MDEKGADKSQRQKITGTVKNAVLEKKAGHNFRRFVVKFIFLVSFAVLIALFITGYSYYVSPYQDRPHRPEYAQLRPAGSLGLTYGIIGSIMMVLMLVYSIRKRTKLLGHTLPMKGLLEFHIYMGVIGPLFIVLHSSFKVQGLVAVSFWSMLAVMLSGYFGRYLYLQIPRNIQGGELTLSEIERMNQELARELADKFGLDQDTLRQVDALSNINIAEDYGVFRALASHLKDDLLRPLAMRKLKHRLIALTNLPRIELHKVIEVTDARIKLQRRLAILSRVQQVFHYWHVIHRPFAIIMYIFMSIHIGVAIWTGYAWF